MQGMPLHCGLRALHAQPVARLKADGLLYLGKLNMHAILPGATNHNSDLGNCNNPLRAGYTPGGSSGGSTAAMAASLRGISLGTVTLVRSGQFLALCVKCLNSVGNIQILHRMSA